MRLLLIGVLFLGGTCIPDASTSPMNRCLKAWQKKSSRYLRVQAARKVIPCQDPAAPALPHLAAYRTSYDIWGPEWHCEDMERIPEDNVNDGPKWMCGLETFAQRKSPLLVYSMGCDGDTAWEKAILKRFPSAEVHIFDPTGTNSWLPRIRPWLTENGVHFHEWWIGKSIDPNSPHPVVSFSQVLEKLGHVGRTIDFLKVDIEEAEYMALTPVILDGGIKFRHLNIELHETRCPEHMSFFNALDRRRYLTVYKEPNHWGCDGFRCIEYTIISSAHACDTFQHDHFCRTSCRWNSTSTWGV